MYNKVNTTMKRVRIGNDICIRWSIYTKEGLPYDLFGKNLRLFLNSAMGDSVPIYDFTTEGNVVVWTYKGKKQKRTGNYTLTLVENFDADDMHTVDSCVAFRLDPTTTPNTSGVGCSNVEISTVELHSELAVSYPTYGVDMKVIEWNDTINLDSFTSSGNYVFAGTRTKTEDDGLPIYNKGELNASLTVSVGGNCIMQKLTLLNVGGGDGNIYLRTQQNGVWEPWGKLQTNVEVGLIGIGQTKTFDDFTDNGMYSGVNAYATGQTDNDGYPIVGAETFVLVVINAYLYGGGISQLKYSMRLDGAIGVATRKKINDTWSEWSAV